MAAAVLTVRELAGALACTPRAVQRRAARERWPVVHVAGAGGGSHHYEVAALPQDVRERLGAEPQEAATPPKAEPMPTTARATAKALILQACTDFCAASDLGTVAAEVAFAGAYNDGAVKLPSWVLEAVPRCSRSSLHLWRKRADKQAERKKRSKLAAHPSLVRVVEGLLAKNPHASKRSIHEYLTKFCADEMAAAGDPSLRAVERFLNQYEAEHAALLTHLRNPSDAKNRLLPAFGSASEDVHRLNQLLELDGTKCDLMLQDGRHEIVGCVDVYSRRLKFLVTPTPTAQSVCLLLRRVLLDWGVPEKVRIDNGREYKSVHFLGTLSALGIDHTICLPFASEQKPFIERGFRTFLHDLVELLDGFIGHSVLERNAIESRKDFARRVMEKREGKEAHKVELLLTADQLQKLCDEWCTARYERRVHDGLESTPFERVASWPHPVRKVEDERALDVLLVAPPRGGNGRTVGKKGVQVGEHHFFAAELGVRVGARVFVRLDPTDASRISVYDAAGEKFICVAYNDAAYSTEERRAEAGAAKAQHRRHIAAGRQRLREAAKDLPTGDQSVGMALLEHDVAAAKGLAMLPRVAAPHATAALEAAGAAAEAGAGAPAEARPVEPVQPRQPHPNSEAAKDVAFAKWMDLSAQRAAGVEIPAEDARFIQLYESSADGRSRIAFHRASQGDSSHYRSLRFKVMGTARR